MSEKKPELVVRAESVESRYPREELISNAQAIFGVAPEVVTGALYGSKVQELTVNEVRKAIDAFLRARPR
ncbi:MAG: hypothetical protein HPY71_01675 [Firmicutes bacterium]|nr:hypothetical protein [Bacillota bacterium]